MGKMQTRKLGKELVVSALGLGCMGMSGVYGAADEAEAIATIHKSINLGCTFLDTADAYGAGHNETLVGKAIKDRRDEVIIATKFGLGDIHRGGANIPVNGRPEYVRSACEASLTRLGIETIDLYYQHRVDQYTDRRDDWDNGGISQRRKGALFRAVRSLDPHDPSCPCSSPDHRLAKRVFTLES
jgi:aryl-alcohol dehydrogenase-like predicted oxidoreductase